MFTNIPHPTGKDIVVEQFRLIGRIFLMVIIVERLSRKLNFDLLYKKKRKINRQEAELNL